VAAPTNQAADGGGRLIEAHKGYQPRVVFFYLVLAILFAVLAGGLAYRQILQRDLYDDRERVQNQRRIVTPGPRGDIRDREGRILAGSRPQVSVVVLLDELRATFRREANRIHRSYEQAIEDGQTEVDRPSLGEINRQARANVMQVYLDQVNAITGRGLTLDSDGLERHYNVRPLLPYVLVPDLEPADYARLLEQLPIDSPLKIYPSSARVYPYGSLAAHVLGRVRVEPDYEVGDIPGDDLTTFRMAGIAGALGLEYKFNDQLTGGLGWSILRVDPSGFRSETVQESPARQGQTLVTSLDVELQQAAEQGLAVNELPGAAVAIDIASGEVLALASAPDYDLNEVSPRFSNAKNEEINAAGGWLNRATRGVYSPGSSFKILMAIAGFRAGKLDPEHEILCTGAVLVGNRLFRCHGVHGPVNLRTAVEKSCNAYFYTLGLEIGVEAIAAEARRFGLDDPTGIDLPFEETRMIVPDPAWKREQGRGPWTQGDTANLSIGQGDLDITPLQMAAFVASVARGETLTRPTLLHDPSRPPQHSEPIGLAPSDYAALIGAMEQVTLTGSGRLLTTPGSGLAPLTGLRVAGKTGTAQRSTPNGTINFAWFIAFAPVEDPQIAIAVMVEGDTPGEETGGGRYAVPVAHGILKAWLDKRTARP
jgi:penicillin-binding protein 2